LILLQPVEGFPPAAHPMPILSAMINAMGSYHNDIMESDEQFDKVVFVGIFLQTQAILSLLPSEKGD
jgi:hypothetical protein